MAATRSSQTGFSSTKTFPKANPNHVTRFSLMLVTVQLTDHGERHVDAIIKTVFQYINMLKKNLPNKPFFEELVVCIVFCALF